MTRLILLTNVWNEEDRIPDLVRIIDAQTLKPKLWFWIDDGSTDGSYSAIINAKTTIPINIFRMPKKFKGELDTIGIAHSRILPLIKDLDFDYLSIADVDNNFDSDYFEKMCGIMDQDPSIGTLSAQSRSDKKRNPTDPMGAGKIVRWSVIRSIDQYWDLAPDTYLNIKANAIGLRSVALQNTFIDAAPTQIFTTKGRFRFGRRMFYVGRPLILVLYQAWRFLFTRDHATEYLRGYWQERSKGSWRCTDPDVEYHYSFTKRIRNTRLGVTERRP